MPVTWERFHREIRCQGGHIEGPDDLAGDGDACVRLSFDALGKVKGQESLVGLAPEQLRCARGEAPWPESPSLSQGRLELK